MIHKRICWNRENISKSGPKVRPKIFKNWMFNERCIGSAKPQRTVFRFLERYYDAKGVIHKRINWNWENISNSRPKFSPNIFKNWIFNEKVHRIRENLTEPFFAFSKDITMLKKWFISAFAEIEKISQNLGPKLGQKLKKIECLMKRCIGSAKPHRTVFRFFERNYDAKEVIHQRISWNWENISNSRPKVSPNIFQNWII